MAENLITLTDSNFEDISKRNPKLVVDCCAVWCGPCKALGPIIEGLAKEFKGKVAFAKLDVDENEETTMRFHIMGVPTLLFIKNGKLVDSIVGVVPRGTIVERMEEVF